MNRKNCLFLVGCPEGNTRSRAVGAVQAGWELVWSVPFWGDTLPAWRRVPQYRFRNGPDVTNYNIALIAGAVRAMPDVVWVEEPMFIYPETLLEIRRRTGATLVCAYSDDPRDPNKVSRHFDNAVTIYDVIFATKDELLQHFFSAGCNYAAKFWKGYDPERIRPMKLCEVEYQRYRSSVVFIGHTDHVAGRHTRLPILEQVARHVPETKIWGRSWGGVNWPNDLPGVVHPCQIDGDLYTKALCAAKVAIQIPSRLARDTHASRSVEIPACGTLLLAERTTDHEMLFEEDKEAVFFGSIAELVDKAKYYTRQDTVRRCIAQAGYERCLRSGYSNHIRIKQMLGIVVKVRAGMWVG